MTRSGFKTFNWVQGQGGCNVLTAGIYSIFRGLKHSTQRRDWAQGEVLKPLLNKAAPIRHDTDGLGRENGD